MTVSTSSTKPVVHHRRFVGTVVRTKTQKTISVEVEQKMMHEKYRKQYSQTSSYQVHDESSVAKVGDHVVFEECRPLSKTKRWRLVEVVKA